MVDSKRVVLKRKQSMMDQQTPISHNRLDDRVVDLETDMVRSGICTHPASFGGLCVICGQEVKDKLGITFDYVHKDFSLFNKEIARSFNTDNVLRQRKLFLVLDLDHTLLNSSFIHHLKEKENILQSKAVSMKCGQLEYGQLEYGHGHDEGKLFKSMTVGMLTKLRPNIYTFLKEASQLFDLYIHTKGQRLYALKMVEYLDPEKKYFKSSSKVISRDDDSSLQNEKDLNLIMGHKNSVIILDDTDSVWKNNRENLIRIKRYHYFASSSEAYGIRGFESFAESNTDESEPVLLDILEILKRVYNVFFHQPGGDHDVKDVRQAMKMVKKKVLQGCVIVFTSEVAKYQCLWKTADQLGATCSTGLDPSVTHVVSTNMGMDESLWAQKHGKFVVHPHWLEGSSFFWQKQPEGKFSIIPRSHPPAGN